MRIFVTGGAGFIGRHLVRALLSRRGSAARHSVTVYDDLSNSPDSSGAELASEGARFIRGDILDRRTLAESVAGHDAVVHLAARTDVAESVRNPVLTETVNVEGTQNVADACAAGRIGRVVFASSAAVYGNCEAGPAVESDPPGPISPYGHSKARGEEIVRRMPGGIVLRLFNVYGAGRGAGDGTAVTKFVRSATSGQEIVIHGDGRQTRDFVHVDDVGGAFLCALETGVGGTYNIASGRAVSIGDLAGIIVRICGGAPVPVRHVRRREGDIMHSRADVSLARDRIGFVPRVSLEQGIPGLVPVPD